MDCHSNDTVDLCPEPECLKSTTLMKERNDLTAPHKPNHSMLKVYRMLFSRDTGRAEKNAKAALEAARETLSDLKAQKMPMPQCVHCKETVSQPCWYCVDCTGKFRNPTTVSTTTPFNIRLCSGEIHLRRLRAQMSRLQRRSHQGARPRQGRRGSD